MTLLGTLKSIAIGAPLGVLALTALPVFGAVGTLTGVVVIVGSVLGSAAAVIDELNAD